MPIHSPLYACLLVSYKWHHAKDLSDTLLPARGKPSTMCKWTRLLLDTRARKCRSNFRECSFFCKGYYTHTQSRILPQRAMYHLWHQLYSRLGPSVPPPPSSPTFLAVRGIEGVGGIEKEGRREGGKE